MCFKVYNLFVTPWSLTIQIETIKEYFPLVLFIVLNKVVLILESANEILKCDHSNESYWQHFPMVLFVMLNKVVLVFESVVKILKCDHSNESYSAVLFCGAVYYAVQGGV